MSITSTVRRRLLGVAVAGGLMLGGLVVPTAAHADENGVYGTCVPVPVTTPGVTVLGEHVPALTHIEICAYTQVLMDIRTPRVTQYSGCGSPCFAVYADSHPVQAGWGGAFALIRWWEDGIEQYPLPVGNVPGPGWAGSDWQAPQEICLVAVGDPTPAC